MIVLLLSIFLALCCPAISEGVARPTSSEMISASNQNNWELLGTVTGTREYMGNWDNEQFKIYVRVIGGVVFYRAEHAYAREPGHYYTVTKNPDYQNAKSKYARFNYYVDYAGSRYYCNLQ